MCGICGFTSFSDNLASENAKMPVLKAMADAIRHRGPDDAGFFSCPSVCLASRRLAIVDPSSGRQPVRNEDSTIIAVWNGEIYNHRSLRSDLISHGHKFLTDHSDSEVIVHLYEEYGPSFVHRLNGMFAIALWDQKKQTLFLFRDRLGVKPLFYYCDRSSFVFASEIRSILKFPEYKKSMNLSALYHYFSFQQICGPDTAYEGIFSLPPGSYLSLQTDSCGNSNGQRSCAADLRQCFSTTKYWTADFSVQSADCAAAGESSAGAVRACGPDISSADLHRQESCAIEQIRFLLEDAVKLRTADMDVPMGAFLSGGLDSSCAAALSVRHLPDGNVQLPTFCLNFIEKEPGPLYDKAGDTDFSVKMSRLLHTDHHILDLDAYQFLDGLDSAVAAMGDPFSGPISVFYLSAYMKDHVKCAISGDGADELFGSYPLQQLAFPMEYINREFQRHALDGPGTGDAGNTGTDSTGAVTESDAFWAGLDAGALSPFSDRRDYLKSLFSFTGGSETKLYYRLLVMTDEEKRMFLSGQKFENASEEKATYRFILNAAANLTGTDPLNRSLEFQLNHAFADQVLSASDRLSMAHSIEIRSPFLDYRLVEYLASLPGFMKMPGGNIKHLLKKAAAGLLPPELISRKKEGFVQPVHSWLRCELKDAVTDTLNMDSIRKYGFFNEEMVFYLLKKYYNDPVTNDYLAEIIWNFFMFQKWCDYYNKGDL